MDTDEVLFPLFVRLRGRSVLVVGGGDVAERKVLDLLEAGATVRVVAPQITLQIDDWARTGRLTHEPRAFAEADLDNALLVFAATDSPEVQREIRTLCDARDRLFVAVDDVAHTTAFCASVIRRPPFTIALSTTGRAPALARLLREVLESALPAADWVAHAEALRSQWKRDRVPMGDRFGALLRAYVSRLT